MTIPIERAYVCGNGHITSESRQCDCGSTNLFSLGQIMNRVDTYSEYLEVATTNAAAPWEN